MPDNPSFLRILPFFIRLKVKEILLCPWTISVAVVRFVREEWAYLLKTAVIVLMVLSAVMLLLFGSGIIFTGLWAYVAPDAVVKMMNRGITEDGNLFGFVLFVGLSHLFMIGVLQMILHHVVMSWMIESWNEACGLACNSMVDDDA